MTANGQHSLKLDISKELFFENFDDPDIKEKVKKITISIVQGDQQNQYTGFGIETSELSPEEMSKVIGHYTENYRDPEMLFQLLGRELKERFREREERLPESKEKSVPGRNGKGKEKRLLNDTKNTE